MKKILTIILGVAVALIAYLLGTDYCHAGKERKVFLEGYRRAVENNDSSRMKEISDIYYQFFGEPIEQH